MNSHPSGRNFGLIRLCRLFLPALFVLAGCGSGNGKQESTAGSSQEADEPQTIAGCDRIPGFKDSLTSTTQLNINVLIDISYRIAPNTPHGKRALQNDLAILEQLARIWKKHLCRKPVRAYHDAFHIRVNEPIPKGLEDYFTRLSFKAGTLYRERSEGAFKRLLSHFEDTLRQRARRIYQTVYDQGYQTEQNWIGSNIYGFFSNPNQIRKCIKPNADNILVVLTDGYLSYTSNNRSFGQGTSFNNLVEDKFQPGGVFYGKDLPAIREEGYQLKPAASDLSNLEVLIAGIDPHAHAADADKLRYFLDQWLRDMQVEQKAIYESKKAVIRNQEDFKNYFYQQ